MIFAVVLEVDDDLLDGDDSIENACRLTNEVLDQGVLSDDGSIIFNGPVTLKLRPLSEVIAS